jgi:uncharacterized membrane protein
VAILGFGARTVPSGDPGTSASAIISEYKQHASAISLAAGWYSFVLLGRILFVAGLRDALRRSGCRTALADFALVAMAVSVVLEICRFRHRGWRGPRCIHWKRALDDCRIGCGCQLA